MIRRPPRSTLDRSSAASDVYKRQLLEPYAGTREQRALLRGWTSTLIGRYIGAMTWSVVDNGHLHLAIAPRAELEVAMLKHCLLYTSDAADERSSVDLGGRRIIKKKTAYHTQQSVSLNKTEIILCIDDAAETVI